MDTTKPNMTDIDYQGLWGRISFVLDAGLPDWRARINDMGQVAAVEARDNGRKWSDNEIFEGIIKAILSNSTDWARIERVLPELRALFYAFDLSYYASLNESHVENVFLPWFKARKAASMAMRRDLTNLIHGAQQLLACSCQWGTLESFIASILKCHNGDVVGLVQELGSRRSRNKVPAMGMPIAAEAVKNFGYDAAKPDRHVNRAIGCFGLVHLSRWPKQDDRNSPSPKEREYVAVMHTMDRFARIIGVRTAFLDNAIWLLCAKSGLHLGNDALKTLITPT